MTRMTSKSKVAARPGSALELLLVLADDPVASGPEPQEALTYSYRGRPRLAAPPAASYAERVDPADLDDEPLDDPPDSSPDPDAGGSPPRTAAAPSRHAPGSRLGRPWTAADDAVLHRDWCVFDCRVVAATLGRSVQACSSRARVLGIGNGQHGLKTVTALARETGYDPKTIQAVAEANDMRPHTLPVGRGGTRRTRRKGFNDEQQEALIDKLKTRDLWAPIPRPSMTTRSAKGEWGTGGKPAACLKCSLAEHPHYARGICRRCYHRLAKGLDP